MGEFHGWGTAGAFVLVVVVINWAKKSKETGEKGAILANL
jgi:hypothetical protein